MKTVFTTRLGLLSLSKCHLDSRATFSRVTNLVPQDLNWRTTLALLDDIITHGKNFEEYLHNISETLSNVHQHGLKLTTKNAHSSSEGLNPWAIPSETPWRCLNQTSKPSRTGQQPRVERLLDLANYHQVFTKDFARLAVPLHLVTGRPQ